MLAYAFLLFAVIFRFVPHPFHFTPIAAALLYFGAKAPRKQAWIPLVVLAVVDVVLNRMYGYAFSMDYFATWAFYAAVLGLGMLLASKTTVVRVAGASLAAAVGFFVISNFMVWLGWSMYPKTLSGLVECYAAAVPFFRNGLAGDLLFSAAFFGLPVAIEAMNRKAAKQTA